MSTLKTESIHTLLETVFEHIGLKDFKLEVAALMTSSPGKSYSLFLAKTIRLDIPCDTYADVADKLSLPIIEAVLSSDAVKAAQAHYRDENLKLIDEVSKLKLQLEQIHPFKVYYDMHFKMSHGKAVET